MSAEREAGGGGGGSGEEKEKEVLQPMVHYFRRLSLFPWHYVTKSIATPPGIRRSQKKRSEKREGCEKPIYHPF